MNGYLLQLAIEGAHLHLSDDAPPISDLALETLARQYITILAIFDRLSQHIPAEVLQELVNMPVVDEEMLLSEAALRPSSATPYGDYISTLRLRSLRLEEERLLEIRRLQVGRKSYLVLYSPLRVVK